MLEILAIVFLTRHLAGELRKKGRSPWIAAVGPVFWIVFEFMGACTAGCMGIEGLVVYLFALIGAAIGAGLAFVVVAAIPAPDGWDPLMADESGMMTSGAACPSCGSVQTEIIGGYIVCNACGERNQSNPFQS